MDQTDAAVKRGDKASEPQTNRVGPRKGIPRYRDYSGPAVFLAGFRPFFLFAAVPNWTGSMPLQGPGLMVLFGLWLLGRIGMSGILPLTLHWAAMLDLSFSLVLAIVILREVLTGKRA